MDPIMNIIAVHHPKPEDVQKEMSKIGFYISKVCEPSALRFVIMPHVTRNSIDQMLEALRAVIKKI
jgi:tyrosine decarboxylase/aspartate 1-decarboxylase